jgi:signal transduction histidine kinase
MSFLDILNNKVNKKAESSEKDAQFKDAFILALVHRLRTPLNGARWALDSVINSENKDSDKQILNEGYNKIISAINMVNEILKVSEINSKDGPLNLKSEQINLCDMVEGILENLDYLMKKKEITLEYDDKIDPIIILGDHDVLDMGLTNLFDNAFRYSPKGKVIVTISKEDNMAKLVITDNGIGISQDDLKHMFEKFYRGKNARLIDPNETGVGLYATKKIIEMHHGRISIDSEENKWTEVIVKLPID